jgi:hypothetical protein
MNTIPERVVIVRRYVTLFIPFLPTNGRYIFSAFEERFEGLDLGGEGAFIALLLMKRTLIKLLAFYAFIPKGKLSLEQLFPLKIKIRPIYSFTVRQKMIDLF